MYLFNFTRHHPMKKSFQLPLVRSLIVLALAAVLLGGLPVQAQGNNVSITLLNPPPNGILELGVGESYTFEVAVSSDQQFISAMAVPDQTYPGRGVFFNGNDSAHQTTSAVLRLTITGKEPTLGATNIPDGIAPVAVVVAVRFQGGVVVTERFDFGVIVQ
jgi:hypothetical protein